MCMLCIYTLLNVVSYYEFSVLSMSVMGFLPKKFGCELYLVLFWIFGICLALQSP